MPYFVIGTAGHVDHGKTSLIKALTGIDADRLREEQERGMTIDLGFAHIKLPSGTMCGIVDVPGHERYLRNMLTGVGGFDFALLVVDAGEGIKAQTREHLEILNLLGIQSGLTVITKIDRVSEEQVNLVEKELGEFLRGSFLESKLIVRVSSVTGEGIPELKRHLDAEIRKLKPRDTSLPFRLPIDRVFTMPGFGTVVTGTVYQGKIERNWSVDILPSKRKGKIRQIQFHNQQVDEAVAGQRIALNISRVYADQIRRGDQVMEPRSTNVTQNIDVLIEVLASAPHPLKNRSEVRMYLATDELFGKVILLDREELLPGEKGYAQILLKYEAAAFPGDRFILRAPSAIYTWGGGTVLDPNPGYHRRFDKSAIEMLKLKEKGDPVLIMESVMMREPYSLYNQDSLAVSSSLQLSQVSELTRRLESEGKLHMTSSGRFTLQRLMDRLSETLLSVLVSLQDANPLSLGRSMEEIRRNLPKLDERMFRELLIYLKSQNKIREWKGLYSTSDYAPKLSPHHARCYETMRSQFEKGGFAPPSRTDFYQNGTCPRKIIDDTIEYMLYKNELTALDPTILFPPDKLEQAKRLVGHFIVKNGGITPAEAREILGTTRKYVIPLLEYLDGIYFTKRQANKRVLFRENVIVQMSEFGGLKSDV